MYKGGNMENQKQKAKTDYNSVYNRKLYRKLNELPYNHLSTYERRLHREMYLAEEYACGLDG